MSYLSRDGMCNLCLHLLKYLFDFLERRKVLIKINCAGPHVMAPFLWFSFIIHSSELDFTSTFFIWNGLDFISTFSIWNASGLDFISTFFIWNGLDLTSTFFIRNGLDLTRTFFIRNGLYSTIRLFFQIGLDSSDFPFCFRRKKPKAARGARSWAAF